MDTPALKVKTIRQALGLTQESLAEKAGITRITVTRLERGDPPSLRTLAAIAKALGTTPAQLLAPSRVAK